jgi:hypothetical protein
MRRLLTWSIVLLVAVVAGVAIVAAIVNDDSPSNAQAVVTNSTTDVSLCDSKQLALSIRASGFGAHVAALRLSGTEPCDVGELQITATVVDRNGQSVPTKVEPPQKFTGKIQPGVELIASFDYSMRCRQKGPFSATVIAKGEVGSARATAPVAFRRDPFTTSPC